MVCRTKYKPWKMIVQMYQSRLFQMWRCWIQNPFTTNQGSTDQNRLVQDQAVRSGPRTRLDQDQRFLRNLGPDRTRTKHFEKSRTDSDQDRKNLRNQGPTRTRTKKNLKISDRTEPGPIKFRKSRTKSDRSVPGPGGPWIPGGEGSTFL